MQGLGTSTSEDAKKYFKNLKSLVKIFGWTEDSGELIDRSFNKSRPDERKTWLLDFQPGNQLDQSKTNIPVPDFIDKELILFSRYDVERSIPSVVDGLKPSQRKILFAAFKRNLTNEMKVAQFSGYVAEHSGYHHGEQSLQGAIVGMAQDYVGSNNMNLLLPNGQFGSRILGGKDCASARYIFTKLSPVTRQVFNQTDDVLLKYLEDDGSSIEPEWYVPAIPFLLVNGANGIGTGFSTDIPSYNVKVIVDNVKRLISGKEMVPMTPWYKGFTGIIDQNDNGTFTCKGVAKVSGKTVVVSELPIGTWTSDYKDFLEGLVEKKVIVDFREKHTEKNVLFEIDFPGEPDTSILKLEKVIRTTNMHAFDPQGKITKYADPLDIIRDWFEVRKEFYAKRKNYLLKDLSHRAAIAENKHRFITLIVNDELVLSKKTESVILSELRTLKFYKSEGSYKYLLDMSISSLSLERAEKLRIEAEKLKKELSILENTSRTQMWSDDLKNIVI